MKRWNWCWVGPFHIFDLGFHIRTWFAPFHLLLSSCGKAATVSGAGFVAFFPFIQTVGFYLLIEIEFVAFFHPNCWIYLLIEFFLTSKLLDFIFCCCQDERRSASFHGSSRSQTRKTSLLKVKDDSWSLPQIWLLFKIVFPFSNVVRFSSFSVDSWILQVASILSFSQFIENSKETYI